MDTRLNRITDRARWLEAHVLGNPHSVENAVEELTFYLKRARQIGRSVALCIMTALLVASVVDILFISAQTGFDLSILIEGIFTVAVLLYGAALVIYLRDIFRVTFTLFPPMPESRPS